MRILAIDPAMNNTGWCVGEYDVDTGTLISVSSGGLITTEKAAQKTIRRSSDDFRRANELAKELVELSQNADVVFSEIPNGGAQNARAVWTLGVTLGILTNIPTKGISMVEVTPNMTKMASIGRKDATKAEIIEWAIRKHPELPWYKARGQQKVSPRNEHLADAVGVLYAGLDHEDFRQFVTVVRRFKHK